MTRASDTAKLLGAGATILDGTTISTADNTAQVTLVSTDADATSGPLLHFQRNSSSPADSDNMGRILFDGKNDADEDTTYVEFQLTASDVSNGSEDASFQIGSKTAGSFLSRVEILPTETVFNEDSADVDFRVESDGNTHAIFVEGSSNNVGIGNSDPTTTVTKFGGSAQGLAVKAGQPVIAVEDTSNAQYVAYLGQSETHSYLGAIGGGDLQFQTGTSGTSKQRITSTGSLVANGVSASTQSAGAEGHFVSLNDGAKYGMISGCDNVANRDAIVFTNPNGLVGTIKTNGSSTSYNTSSDYRLKENVSYSFDATSRLKQLKPARFNFIADSNTTVDGFLAHEVSSIVPEAISGTKDETKDIGTIKDKDGVVVNENVFESAKEDGQTWEKTGTKNIYQNIDQAKLVPLLVKTIQELEARITTLENA